MEFFQKTATTECSIPFTFIWKINNYLPKKLVSPAFSHPLFTKDVWFMEFLPHDRTIYSKVIFVPPSDLSLTVGVRLEWNNHPFRLMSIGPSCRGRFQISPPTDSLDGSILINHERSELVTTSFSIKCTLCYPSSIVDSVEPLIPSLEHEMSKLLKDLAIQRDRLLSGDFEQKAGDDEGKSVSVHSLVLASRSSVFRAMLSMESDEKKSRRVILQGTPSTILHPLVDFLYADRIAWASLNFKTVVDLFVFADQYDIQGLRKMTEAFISCNIKTTSDVELARQLVGTIDSEPISGAVSLFESRDVHA